MGRDWSKTNRAPYAPPVQINTITSSMIFNSTGHASAFCLFNKNAPESVGCLLYIRVHSTSCDFRHLEAFSAFSSNLALIYDWLLCVRFKA
jgi:hypothetical protein